MICKKCGRENLRPEDFHKNSQKSSGLRSTCKLCRNSQKQKDSNNLEERKAKSLQYYYKNREARIEYQKKRYYKKKEEEAKKTLV